MRLVNSMDKLSAVVFVLVVGFGAGNRASTVEENVQNGHS